MVGTLTTPSIPTGDYQTYTFTASGDGIDLAANTQYWFVVDVTATTALSSIEGLAYSASDNEDAGGASGWTIADSLSVRTWSSSGSYTSDSASLQIQVNGVAKPVLATSVTFSMSELSTSTLRLLETGSATYTVVLDAQPNANVTMTITKGGTHSGAATISPMSHTFTSGTNGTWDDPVTITVTGVDQNTGGNRNRNHELTLSHAFTSTDSRYNNISRSLPVKVDDAPEVEAWEGWVRTIYTGVVLKRPKTITATLGININQDIHPGPLAYVIRLSNRPATGGTVTVTARVGDSNLAGLSLTHDGAPQSSLTLTFKDRDPSPHCDNSHHNGGGEDHDNTADTSWQCWRKVWVHDLAAGKTGVLGCTDITHTATGGGVRGMTGPYTWSAGTIRAHMMSQSRRGPNGQEFRCPMITGKSSSPGMGSQNSALQVAGPPTDPVANLQLAALDASSAQATWDAVAGATGYRVEWEATDGLNVVAGVQDGVTETTFTIAHNTPSATTLTVRVLPEHVDGDGNPQALDALAGTATLALGSTPSDSVALQNVALQGVTETALKACVSDELLATAERLYERNRNKPPHYAANWFSVLLAFGQRTPSQWTADDRLLTPMTAASARQRGWRRFGDALACLEEAVPGVEAMPGTPLPAVRLAAGAAVTEGAAAAFTLEVGPAPAADLAVTVAIAQTGTVLDAAALGERTVTVPAGQTEAAFTVATAADDTDEPAGAVTATVAKQDGYAVDKEHGGASATVTVADDDATAVTLAAPAGDVPETGGSKTLTVTLGRALVEGERLSVPLLFGGAATLGSDYTLSAPETAPQGVTYADLAADSGAPALTFTGPAAAAATLILTATADGAAEGESETVTGGLGTLAATGLGGGADGAGTVSFAILEPPPEIAIAAKTASITEGTDAAFTVTASRAAPADLTVTFTVAEADGSDFVAAAQEGAATVTIEQGETEAAFTVPTVDDAADEPDGTVTVTLAGDGEDGRRYTVAASPGDAAAVAVADNDAASTLPLLSIGDETVHEQDGLVWFTVRLSKPAGKPVSVHYRTRHTTPVSAREGVDYLKAAWHLDFGPDDTEQRFWVYVYNDSHDEDPETFEVALMRPSAGVGLADGVAVGTIVNSDPMPKAWLSRFGRTVAQQTLDGIAGRLAAPRTPGAQGTLAGQAFNLRPSQTGGAGAASPAAGAGVLARLGQLWLPDLAQGGPAATTPPAADGRGNRDPRAAGAGGLAPRPLTVHDLLLGSHFTATTQPDAHGGSLAFWGRAAQTNFDGREGTFALDGEVLTGLLGVDYARDHWLLGVTLLQSTGTGGYDDHDAGAQPCPTTGGRPAAQLPGLCGGAIREGAGAVESTLTAAVPYAALQASDRLKLWGAAGYGAGEVTLTPETGGTLKTDIAWTMAEMGLRGTVLTPPPTGRGPTLAVTSDALWARTTSEKVQDGLAASDAAVTRLRLGLEGRWPVALETAGQLTPTLALGARHDGGDAETGFGVELGGGLAWTAPQWGLSLNLEGRTLLTHRDADFQDQGVAVAVAFDPDPATPRGPSLSLRQDWGGAATGGLDALFASAPLAQRTGTTAPAMSRWMAEGAWGFPVFGGRFTGSPHVGLGLAPGTRDYRLGWRLVPATPRSALALDLQATRQELNATRPAHTVGLELSTQW